jgi:hypothetical protein
MRKVIPFFYVVGLLLAFTGCQTPSGLSKLTVTDDKEMNYKWPKPIEHFESGEIPVVRVIGCEGKNITLQIINLASGEIVIERNAFFPDPTIKTEPERIKMDHLYGFTDEPVVPIRSTQVDVYRKRLFLHLNHLSAGAYEARLLVEGKLAEKSSFRVSN